MTHKEHKYFNLDGKYRDGEYLNGTSKIEK